MRSMKYSNRGKHIKGMVAVVTTGTLLVHSPHAFAQTEATATLEEVVVTAQKREESLQDTPLAVTALTPTELMDAGVKDFSNIDKVAPSVQVFQGAGATVLAIRGLRSTSFDPVDESPNAVHVDGNYIARNNGMNGFFYDLQRVEILAGPQGTLFGRNAASGVINIITSKPVREFGAGGTLEVGNFALVDAQGFINAPLTDTLALRVAARYLDRDGYYVNGQSNAGQKGGRLQLAWEPGENLSVLLGADVEKLESKTPGQNIVQWLFTSAANPVPPRWDNRYFQGNATHNFTNNELSGVNTQIDYSFDFATLTFQSAYRDMDEKAESINAQNAFNTTPRSGHSTTAELRLTSNGSQPLQWVGGLFYFDDFAKGGTSTTTLVQLGPFPPGTMTNSLQLYPTTTKSYAAFGQATWTPSGLQALHLTAGLRYNYDKKTGTTSAGTPFGTTSFNPSTGCVGAEIEGSACAKDWDKETWKAGVAYDITDASMVYANASTGYKSGGFVYGFEPVTPPQNIDAYEIGSKNRFFNDSLQLNISAFMYDYTNFEQTYLRAVGGGINLLTVTTVGSADVQGVELEALWALTRNDRVNLAVNFLEATFGEFNLSQLSPALPNLTNQSLPNTPKWAIRSGYTHTFMVGEGTLDAGVDVQWTDERGVALIGNFQPTVAGGVQNKQIVDDAYTVVDMSLRYTSPNGKWNVTAYGRNITDEVYYYSAAYSAPSPTNVYPHSISASQSPPRTYGIIFGVRF